MDQVAYPKKLTIALTDRCNLKCFICQRDEYEQLIGSRGQNLDLAHLNHLESAIRHAEMISLTGFGESFLHPQLHEILDYIYALNPRDNLIMLISNGTALSYEHGRKLGRRLRELVVSLNAANPEAYQRDMHPEANRFDYAGDLDPRVRLEKLNGRGLSQFEKACGKIREFLRGLEPEDRTKVRLHYVVHRDNIAEMEDFVLVARELGCSTVGFYQYMVTQESRIDYSIFLHKEAYNEAFDRAQALGRLLGVKVDGTKFSSRPSPEFNKESDCTSPFDEVIVNTNGDVVPCCHVGAGNLGNAFAAGFDAVWLGQQYRKLREERHLNGCQTCNVHRLINDAEVHFHPAVKATARYRETLGRVAETIASSSLKVLVIATGASGSRSLSQLLKSLYAANNADGRIGYITDSYSVSESAIQYVTRGDTDYATKVVKSWKDEVVVGSNLAFLIPVIRSVFGPDLKIIHLKRDREDAATALLKRAELFPQNWGGYVPNAEPCDIVRPTAYHFNEMDMGTWDGLGLRDRIAWYYDKSHALIEAARADFPNWLDLATDDLSNHDTIARIASFIDPEWAHDVAPVHVNATSTFDLGAISDPYERIRLARLLQDFDVVQALGSKTYPIGFFVYAMTATPVGGLRSGAESAAKLKPVMNTVEGWIAAAKRYRFSCLPAVATASPRRIRNPLLSPEEQIKLEQMFRGFDIRRMAADEGYAATFFIERLVAPHRENLAIYASLVEALRPISEMLRAIILDNDAGALSDDGSPEAGATTTVNAA